MSNPLERAACLLALSTLGVYVVELAMAYYCGSI